MSGILEGLRVLDLSRMLSGPYCTMLLADHGAEVIKVESAEGDTSRQNGPYREDDAERQWAGYFVSLNRSKKSVQLDLKSEEGREAFRSLSSSADALIENFRPGVMERLDLSYERLAEDNPRLVYAAIRGFGDPRTGASPYSDWPAYDVVAQAMGGIAGLTGPDAKTPTKVGPGIGDVFAGVLAAFGVLAALRVAEATGQGQFLDVAMYDAIVSLCERAIYQHDFDGTVPGPEGNGHPFLTPFGIYPARDGHVAIGIVDDFFWQALASAMGRDEIGNDPRYASRAARLERAVEINAEVAEWTCRQSKAELTKALGGVVPFGPVNTVADIFVDPHVAARGVIAEVPHAESGKRGWRVAANPLRFASHPTPAPSPPPRLGEHGATSLATVDTPFPNAPSPDALALRRAFGAFATGVTVLTARQKDGTPRGFTANSFTSVSLDPPLLLVCLAKSAHSCGVFMEAEHFSVNVLGEEQKAVSGLFASRAPDKFEQCDWREGAASLPMIDGALARFACCRERLADAGDHIVLIGRVIDFDVREGNPLGYFRGSYFSIGLEDRLVSAVAASGGTRIGAVLTRQGQLLLEKGKGDALSVPAAAAASPSLEGLRADLEAKGLSPVVEFLYAVYEDRDTRLHGIYYHGTFEGEPSEDMVLAPLDNLPLERVASDAERSMLHRYAREFRHGAFGIYLGNETDGTVRRVSGI